MEVAQQALAGFGAVVVSSAGDHEFTVPRGTWAPAPV